MAKKTRVRVPGGALVTVEHPDGATDDQILAFARQQAFGLPVGEIVRPSIGPASDGPGIDTVRGEQELMRRVQEQLQATEPQFQRPFGENLQHQQLVTAEQGRAALPMVAGTALSTIPGGIIPSALMFGAGAGGGELLKNVAGGTASLQQAASTGLEGVRDSLVGGAIFRALAPVGRFIFGRPATAEGQAALEFARNRSGELADEARAMTPSGVAVPTAAADAIERGAPRLPIDSITDGQLLQGAKMLLAGEIPANGRAKQAAQFINRELASFVGEVPKTASVVQDAKQLVFVDDSLKSLRQFNHLTGDQWIDEVVTGANATALNQLARSSPDLHRQVLAKNLESVFNQFTRSAPDVGMGLKALDGRALREWVVANGDDIARVYGPGVAQKLDSFSNYAQFLDDAVLQAERGPGGSLGKLGTLLRGTAEGGGWAFLPKVILPLQGSAWVLGNTLMNPSSMTFRFFAALPKAGRTARTAMEAGAEEADAGRHLPSPAEMFR